MRPQRCRAQSCGVVRLLRDRSGAAAGPGPRRWPSARRGRPPRRRRRRTAPPRGRRTPLTSAGARTVRPVGPPRGDGCRGRGANPSVTFANVSAGFAIFCARTAAGRSSAPAPTPTPPPMSFASQSAEIDQAFWVLAVACLCDLYRQSVICITLTFGRDVIANLVSDFLRAILHGRLGRSFWGSYEFRSRLSVIAACDVYRAGDGLAQVDGACRRRPCLLPA